MKLKDQYIGKETQERLYQTEVPVIGLTGGIATGKSTVSKILQEKGFQIICADTLVKNVYKTSKTIDYLKQHHREVIDDKNEVDFKKLRELFFSSKTIQANIEQLIYSQMPDAFTKERDKLNNADVIFYDVPLLFEKSLDKLVDLKVVVYCSPQQQIERLMKRDGINKELAANILSKQMPIDEKKKLADIVIDNSEEGPKLAPLLECFQ
jgi:dephospho-CoA kinase